MNLKQKMRNFFTLNRKSNGGFTLVELIVVIAILAILGGVAVPVYSGYVKRANKQADITLISEVANALTLYYYSNSGEAANGFVILNQEGDSYTAENYNAAGDAAMTAAFGADWKNTVFLKHADWTGVNSTLSYKDSSYHGKETKLINTVDSLTTALGKVIEQDASLGNTLIGGNFQTFLNGYDVDTDNGKAVGNAAVLYVAQNTKGKEAEIKQAITAGINRGGTTPSAVADYIYTEVFNTGVGDAAAMAAVYAYAEAYAQYTNQAHLFNPNFSAVSGPDAADDALAALGEAFDKLDPAGFPEYLSNQSDKDVQAYIDMMGTVYDNRNIVSDNLHADDCYTDGTVENMLKGHAEMSSLGITTENGQAAVVLVVGANGSVMTCVAPANYNK